jgi:hypothetical protein
MLAKARARMTFANVTSLLALFVALGGTAYAAATIGSDDVINDSLLGEDVKQGTLKAGDIASNTISSTRVADGTLVSEDIKDGTIGSADVAPNSLGGGRITDNSLKGTDIQESSLTGIAAAGASPYGNDPTGAPSQGTGHDEHTIQVPAAGQLIVQGSMRDAAVGCGPDGSCTVEWGLYVDGTPVPGTVTTLQAEAGQSSAPIAFLVTGVVPVDAGAREVSFGLHRSEHANYLSNSGRQTNSIFVKG